MKNSLYYTPEINELHIGFECEVLGLIGTKEDQRLFSQTTIISQKELPILHLLEIRVKFLDQSDIESLGWRFGTNDYVFPENKNVTYGQHKLLFNNNELEIIHLSGTLFRGTIKNKSELIKLMKQLNIK
jgi:hypothetical protein